MTVINIPSHLYNRLEDLATSTQQTVENWVIQQLESNLALPKLPPDDEAELAALHQLSNDALRTIAAEQMPQSTQDRMQFLMGKNNFGTISDSEYTELENLVERGQRLMLRKAEAAVILLERGEPFTQADFNPHG